MEKYLFFIYLTLNVLYCRAQEKIASDVTLTEKTPGITGISAPSKTVVSLKEGTIEFSVNVQLFPIVHNPDTEDSLEQQRKPLVLKMKGKFPIDNLDFRTVDDNGKTFTVMMNASLNDSARTIPMTIALVILRNPSISPNGNTSYPAKIDFACQIDPKNYGINKAPFNVINPILIEASEVIINKN